MRRTSLYLFAAIMLVACSTPTSERSDEVVTKEASATNVIEADREYPEACTVETDENDDGESETLESRVIVDDKIVQTAVDKDGDRIYDRVSMTAYAPEGAKWSEAVDKNADGEIDMRSGVMDKEDNPVPWLMRPKARFHERGEVVEDDNGRVVGAIESKSGNRRGGKGMPAHNKVSARLYDDAGRVTAEFVVLDTTPEDDVIQPDTVRERVSYDEDADQWSFDHSGAALQRVWLARYDGDSKRVLAEALWEGPEGSQVPGLDSTLEGVGLDQPHTIRSTGDDRVVAPPMPEDWRESLQFLVVRQVDDAGEMTHFWRYVHLSFEDGSQGLALTMRHRRTRNDEGQLVRLRYDSSDRVGTSRYADGIFDVDTRYRLEDGHRVRGTMRRLGTDPDLDLTSVPQEYLSVPLERQTSGEEVEPRLVDVVETSWVRDNKGNPREKRERSTRSVVEYRRDDDGNVTWRGRDGRARPRSMQLRSIEKLNGTFDLDEAHDYDDAGRKTTTTRRYWTHGGESVQTITFKYSDGVLAQERIDTDRAKKGPMRGHSFPPRIVTHEYDGDGRRVRSVHTREGSDRPLALVRYDYDDAGRRIAETWLGREEVERAMAAEDFDPFDFAFHRHYAFRYDDDGRRTTKYTYEKGSRIPSRRTTYGYDEGRRVRASHFVEGRQEKARREELEQEVAPPDPREIELPLKYVTDYQYDADGHLIREVDREPAEVETYGYECYEE